jgi:acetyl-CoA synthetase
MTREQDLETVESALRGYQARYTDPDASAADLFCDSHPAQAVAFTLVQPDLTATDLTYEWLREQSARFARGLTSIGVKPGDRVATLMGKSADFLVAVLGIWRLGAVHVPLFTAFAPGAISLRLASSAASAVICDEDQRSKLAPGEDMPSDPPWRVITTGRGPRPGDRCFADLLASGPPLDEPAVLGGDGPLVQIYTSGTTGMPKGVVLPISGVAALHAYLDFGLDVRADDVYWCAADPGWAYGLYYAVIGPMAAGRRSVLLEAGFTPELTWRVLVELGVTNFAAAPTIFRALRAGAAPTTPVGLRCASSAGEPLTPEVNEWAVHALGVEVHDHYGQTEHGMLVNNHQNPALNRPLRPGSMGQPMPGWKVAILRNDADEVAPVGEVGRVAVRVEESSLWWFGGYHESPEATAARFTPDGRWYLTGDAGSSDQDGYITFCARDDDVIIMAGYRIGPFEVESVLATHPAVAECAVVGIPDPLRGEVIEAFVVLREPTTATTDLAEELQSLVKTRYAAHAYPRRVHFVDSLPKTPSGKVQRFQLRDQRRAELAEPAAD